MEIERQDLYLRCCMYICMYGKIKQNKTHTDELTLQTNDVYFKGFVKYF
jgi:hypothetical protein